MFSSKLLRSSIPYVKNARCFRTTNTLKDVKTPSSPKESSQSSQGVPNAGMRTPSALDKRLLVWQKKYPSVDEVPDKVPDDSIQSAMSKFRIRIANILMLISLGYIVWTVSDAKREQKEMLATATLATDDFHKQINAEYRQRAIRDAAEKKA